jgi:DNA-binding transcriptional regulator YiaG
MAKIPNPILVTPQQIRRFVRGHGWSTLADAEGDLEPLTNQSLEAADWEIWEKKGLRASDMASEIAKQLAEMVNAYEEGSLILSPSEIRSWREGMGLSQPEAAEYLGVARSTWSRWEQLGIVDNFAGTAAYALAASVAAKNPDLLAERNESLHKVREMEIALGRTWKDVTHQAIAISGWGGNGTYARLGLGSFGLYQLLREAWNTLPCTTCSAMNPTDASYCASCGSALVKEVTQP